MADPRRKTEPERLTRRGFLRRSMNAGSGALAGSTIARLTIPRLGVTAALLAACSEDPVAPTVVPLFSPDRVLVAGRPQRIPFAIVSPDPTEGETNVALPPDDGAVDVVVERDGSPVLETSVSGRVVNHDHVGGDEPEHQHANLFRYYPLRATLDEPGIYDLTIAVEGTEAQMAVQIFDADEVEVLLPGEPFPPIVTPTFDSPEGVDRLCTRFEPCPFHVVSADEVVGAGRPVAMLIATPAFCSTAYCGPVLETLMAEATSHPDIEFIHVEVYANPDEVDGN
ncbi:MAG: hypothetical protein ACR2QK_21855, partial [Acidimicrobiales bacterium]